MCVAQRLTITWLSEPGDVCCCNFRKFFADFYLYNLFSLSSDSVKAKCGCCCWSNRSWCKRQYAIEDSIINQKAFLVTLEIIDHLVLQRIWMHPIRAPLLFNGGICSQRIFPIEATGKREQNTCIGNDVPFLLIQCT